MKSKAWESLEIQNEDGDLQYPIAFFQGGAVLFGAPEGVERHHVFGGELPRHNAPQGAELHTLLRIQTDKCELLRGIGLDEIPLIFGLRHDGCELEYSVDSNGEIDVSSLKPINASSDWPYRELPSVFPSITLGSSYVEPFTRAEFEETFMHQSMPGSAESVLILIPPCPDLPVSLWGPEGDAEMVHCVFTFEPKTRTVEAMTHCS